MIENVSYLQIGEPSCHQNTKLYSPASGIRKENINYAITFKSNVLYTVCLIQKRLVFVFALSEKLAGKTKKIDSFSI